MKLPRPALSLVFFALLFAPACTERQPDAAQAHSFATPDEAVAALVAALETHDSGALARVLGPDAEALVSSGDEVADRAAREAFLRRYREAQRLVAGGPDDLVLQVGADQWPLPIPLARAGSAWRFDAEAGAAEMLSRRIGANELRTIDVMRSFVGAQQEYAAQGRDENPPGIFAQRLRSEPGAQNGLFWEVQPGEPPSPAGPFLAGAEAEGYDELRNQPYHGYLYRMLLAQGPAANGGQRDYVVRGELSGGFALLAYPAVYGVSGVMTFMVNHDGVVWQRDLGEETAEVAPAIDRFNPDEHWTPLAPETPDARAAALQESAAARNCRQLGGRLIAELDRTGREYHVCVFVNERQCEAWALLRAECPASGVRVAASATQAARYCVINGGRYIVTARDEAEEQGLCAFQDGRRCDAAAFYGRACSRRDTGGCGAA